MIQKITTIQELENAIQLLEAQKTSEWPLLKGEFLNTVEGFKPLNIIKNSIEEFSNSPELKKELVITSLGLVAGIVSKKILDARSQNPVMNVVRTLLQVGVSFFGKKREKVSGNNGESRDN